MADTPEVKGAADEFYDDELGITMPDGGDDNADDSTDDKDDDQPQDPDAAGDDGSKDDKDESGDDGAAKGYWPDDWREKHVDGLKDKEGKPLNDEDRAKELKILQRYASPNDVLAAHRAAQKKITNGEYKIPLAKDASKEEVAAWRKENGIPEKFTDYDITLPDGLVVGEEDKELVGSFLEVAHASNTPPETVKEMLSWYYQAQEKQMEDLAVADQAFIEESINTLREEWGRDYKPNVNAAHSLVASAPGDLPELLMGGRLANGSALGNSPEFLKWFAGLARQINPAATLVAGEGDQALQSLEDKVATNKERMKTDREGWFKDKTAQAEHLKLLEAIERMKGAK